MEINNLTHAIIGCAFKVHKFLAQAFWRESTKTLSSWNSTNCTYMLNNRNSFPCYTKVKLLALTTLIFGSTDS